MNIEQELGRGLKSKILKNEPMSRHTSWQVGGPADYLICPADSGELQVVTRFCHERGMPLHVVGSGTNLLVLDGGIRGLVVKIAEPFNHVRVSANRLEAGAGIFLTRLAEYTAEAGLGGLEFVCGIPGSLGGALVMNAGAFGGSIGEKVLSVELVDYRGNMRTCGKKDLQFAYRSSSLAGRGIITGALLELEVGEPAQIRAKMEEALVWRGERHPRGPSAGSVFRNLPHWPAGKVIEEAGARGMSIGGAKVSEIHANFIINTGGATASDILNLIRAVQESVRNSFGLELQPEVKIIGEHS